MNRDELFERTRAILNPDLTARHTFLILGAGSGGARLAEEAARFGVGRIILVDRPGERLEEHNLIRHPLGYSALGRLKLDALRDRLLDIHPACVVDTHPLDVTREEPTLEQLMRQSTQVHLCTDNEPSKHIANACAVRTGATLIFAGVFDGGCGGEVGRVRPGEACYACIATHLQRGVRFDEPETPAFDYTRSNAPVRSTAALNIDIAQVALLHARVALITLMADAGAGPDIDGNYLLFGNRPVTGLFDRMLANELWRIPANPDCLICQQRTLAVADADALLASAAVQPIALE